MEKNISEDEKINLDVGRDIAMMRVSRGWGVVEDEYLYFISIFLATCLAQTHFFVHI